jgi:OOP family OmpA-OmpF porin
MKIGTRIKTLRITKFFLITLLSTTVCETTSLYADDQFKRAPWIGVSAGSSLLQPDASKIMHTIEKDTDAAVRAAIGLDLNHRFAAEISFSNLGQVSFSDGHFADYRLTGVDALAYVFANKKNRFHRQGLLPFLRLGVSKMSNRSDIDFRRENDTSIVIGAGAEYAFANGLSVRADLISFDADAHYAGLGLIYRFKRSSTGTRAQKELVSKNIVATQFPTNVETDANAHPDVMFYLNHHDLNADALKTVAMLSQKLKSNSKLDVTLTGFSNSSGDKQHNQTLSERRAQAVRSALIQSGIDESRISLMAKGETERFSSLGKPPGIWLNQRVEVQLITNREVLMEGRV